MKQYKVIKTDSTTSVAQLEQTLNTLAIAGYEVCEMSNTFIVMEFDMETSEQGAVDD